MAKDFREICLTHSDPTRLTQVGKDTSNEHHNSAFICTSAVLFGESLASENLSLRHKAVFIAWSPLHILRKLVMEVRRCSLIFGLHYSISISTSDMILSVVLTGHGEIREYKFLTRYIFLCPVLPTCG